MGVNLKGDMHTCVFVFERPRGGKVTVSAQNKKKSINLRLILLPKVAVVVNLDWRIGS